MSLEKKFLFVHLAIFSLSFIGLTLYLVHHEGQQHYEEEIQTQRKVGESLVSIWKTTMQWTGSDNLARDQLSSVKDRHKFSSLQLARNPKFTRINAESSPYVSTELERKVLAEGKPHSEILSKGPQGQLLTLIPIKAEEACVTCHRKVNNHPIEEGEVMAVLSLTTSLKHTHEKIAADRRNWVIGFSGVLLVLVLTIHRIVRNLTAPLKHLTAATRKIAEGDLGTRVKVGSRDKPGDLTQGIKYSSKDEVGQLADAFGEMQASLAALAKGIKEAGLKIGSLSSGILATSKQQSDGAAEQAAAVEEVGATIEELSNTAGQIANNTNDVVTAAEKTLKSAESGQAAITETTDSMEDIRIRTLTSSQKIVALGEKSQQIGSVLELINEIVAETKMLSLNASIEASKAGETGKGFSVVAAEIRKLAEKATNSTATIEDIITEIQSSVNETIMGTEENVKRVEAQAQLVKKVGTSLEEILPLAEATVELARQISAATHQQKAGSEQVVASVKEISDVSKQTAASSREATASAEELDSLAERLKEGFQALISRVSTG